MERWNFATHFHFGLSFQKFEVSMFYTGTNLGTYEVKPLTINPSASAVQEGVFSSENMSNAQHTFMTF